MFFRLLTLVLLGSLMIGQVVSTPIDKDECRTPECDEYASMLQENMDVSVNPCDDFFTYNCGKFVSSVQLRGDQESFGQFRRLDQNLRIKLENLLSNTTENESDTDGDDIWTANAKAFYKSCTNLEKVGESSEKFLMNFFNSLGGWPMITGEDNPNLPLDLLKKIYHYGFTEFVNVGIMINPMEPNRHIIKIYQQKYYANEFYESEKFEIAYKGYLENVTLFLNPDRQEDLDEVRKEIDQVFQLEKSLAKIRLSISDQKNATQNREMKLKDLYKQIPDFPWIDFIVNGIFENQTNINLTEDEPVSINDWDFLEKVQVIYKNYTTNNPRAAVNFIFAGLMSTGLNDFMPQKYQSARLELSKILSGIDTLERRMVFCIRKAEKLLPNEIGRLYVTKHFSPNAKQDVNETVSRLVVEFKEMLDDNKWMDDVSKDRVRDKANNVKLEIGYPAYYNNLTFIKTNYNYVLDAENFLKNYLTILEYNQQKRILSMLREPVDKQRWFITAATVNAFYDRSGNRMFFPAGILTPPFYHPNLPKYINFGAIGYVAGHELTHGFDDQGRNHDREGRFFQDGEGLWTKDTVEEFKKRTKCMIEQYGSFLVEEVNKTLNGVQTLGENIADNGGLTEAYLAYKSWVEEEPTERLEPLLSGFSNFTQDQMFFISAAQIWCSKSRTETLRNAVLTNTHSIHKFRVIGMMQNSDEFHSAFGCERKVKKCTIW